MQDFFLILKKKDGLIPLSLCPKTIKETFPESLRSSSKSKEDRFLVIF